MGKVNPYKKQEETLQVVGELRAEYASMPLDTKAELQHFLDVFRTEEITEEDIFSEMKAVRKERYEKQNSANIFLFLMK